MKCQTVIDPQCEEMVLIRARERTDLVEELERLATGVPKELIGYEGKSIVKLDPAEIACFTVEENKVCALVNEKKLWVKERLYVLEEMLSENFVKINQSCIANIRQIERFEASFAGALLVVFRNGHRDYVSRRQLKNVKERIGFRL